MTERTYTIYGLHAGDNKIRYIGCTVNPRVRLNEHRSPAHQSVNANIELSKWASDCGESLCMTVLETLRTDDRSKAEELEARWISDSRDKGYELHNILIGLKWPDKESHSWFGRKHTAEWRLNASERISGEKHHFWGKSLSEEHRAKIGRAGSKNRNAIFTADDVELIRITYGMGASTRALAKSFGVAYSTMRRLVLGETYKHD